MSGYFPTNYCCEYSCVEVSICIFHVIMYLFAIVLERYKSMKYYEGKLQENKMAMQIKNSYSDILYGCGKISEFETGPVSFLFRSAC